MRFPVAALLAFSELARAATVCAPRDLALLVGAPPAEVVFRLEDVRTVASGELAFRNALGEGFFAVVWSGTWTPPGAKPRAVIVKRYKQTAGFNEIERQVELEYRAYRALGRDVEVIRFNGQLALVIPDPQPGVRRLTLDAVAIGAGTARMPETRPSAPGRAKTLEKLTDATVDAVTHLENHGVSHGDIKPANLLVDRAGDGFHVEAIDFGMSLVAGRTSPFLDLVVGTPAFMGQEAYQAGEEFTARRHADALAETIKQLYLGDLNANGSTDAHVNATGSFQASRSSSNVGGSGSPAAPASAAAEVQAGTRVQNAAAPGPATRAGPRMDGPDYVIRPAYGGPVRKFARVPDDIPSRIPPQLALVLDGHVASSAKELKALIATSRLSEEEFVKAYATTWQKAFRDADPIRREILAYGLLSSRKFSATVFETMTDVQVKKTLVSAAKTYLDWTRRDPPPSQGIIVDNFGFHPGMGPELTVFLESAPVRKFDLTDGR